MTGACQTLPRRRKIWTGCVWRREGVSHPTYQTRVRGGATTASSTAPRPPTLLLTGKEKRCNATSSAFSFSKKYPRFSICSHPFLGSSCPTRLHVTVVFFQAGLLRSVKPRCPTESIDHTSKVCPVCRWLGGKPTVTHLGLSGDNQVISVTIDGDSGPKIVDALVLDALACDKVQLTALHNTPPALNPCQMPSTAFRLPRFATSSSCYAPSNCSLVRAGSRSSRRKCLDSIYVDPIRQCMRARFSRCICVSHHSASL